jgi:hypothetical protein
LPPRVVSTRRKWVVAALALAAGLALAALMLPVPVPLPKGEVRQPAVTVTPPVPPAFAANSVQPAGVPPAKKRPARSRSIHRAAEAMDYFLALDNEPIESGVVMRVGVNPGNLQADIVFGPDGRAHAIRLVSGK